MAVEIVKPGTPPKSRPMEGTCYNCKCGIKCLASDAKWQDGDRPFDYGNWLVRCPTDGCGADIAVGFVK
jgi:hypothetical protein